MGDMEQIRELVTRLLTSNADAQAAADNRQRELLQQVLAGRPDAAVVRVEKIAKLGAALRKSSKIRTSRRVIVLSRSGCAGGSMRLSPSRSYVVLLTPCPEMKELAYSETG